MLQGVWTWRVQIVCAFLFILLNAFTVAASIHNIKNAILPICISVIAWLWIFSEFTNILKVLQNLSYNIPFQNSFFIRHKIWTIRLILIAPVYGYVLFQAFQSYEQCMSLIGLILLILLSCMMSKYPSKIKLWPLVNGLWLQFVMALVVLKWNPGKEFLNMIMVKTVGFLNYAHNGTRYVYGFVSDPPNICGMDAPYAFTSLPVITFFGALCNVLYYWGVMQWLLVRLATVFEVTLGTTTAESLNAVSSSFLGPTEASVFVSKALSKMTQSEIVSTMTAGYAMISSSLFTIYINFGACPLYLIASNVMSAPAVLVVSKLVYPEVRSKKSCKKFNFPSAPESSVLESLCNGATASVPIIASILVNLIVSVALIVLIDTSIRWLGGLVGHSEISFNQIMSWIFYPFAYILGVVSNSTETANVAKLIGLKTVLNEFYAYQQMQEMLLNNEISGRSQLIAVFALCGYSNFSQIASQIGIFSALCPSRQKSFVKAAVISMISGEIACFMTAAIAGIILGDVPGCMPNVASSNCLKV